MGKKKRDATRSAVLFVAIGVLFLWGFLAFLDITGTFSVTAAFQDPEFAEVEPPMGAYLDGCTEMEGLSSVRDAPQELGTEEFQRLASRGSFVSADGGVWYCD